MHVPKRDLIATVLVAAAGILYLLWAADTAPPGLSGTRATGMAVLGLGFIASASAVVPGFDDLIHHHRGYLAITSLIGLVAFGARIEVLLDSSGAALGVLIVTTLVLWVIATAHHVLLARPATAAARGWPGLHRHGPRPAGLA